MRHRVHGKKIGRNTAQRKALRLALAIALLQNERIQTTRAKAEFVRGYVEKLITTAKRGLAFDDVQRGVHARRIAGSRLNNDRELVGKLFDTLAPRYKDREGGYTRIFKLEPRHGDRAEMVLLELVDRDEEAHGAANRRA
ncbi:MAG: 50S ribosomal protein L17 [Chloroflexota bacterium]|nr:50S ribosomal protein L17 [Chloroflexota bacterium]